MGAELVAQKWAGSLAALLAGLLTWLTAGTTGIPHLNEFLGLFVTATWFTFYFRYFGMLEASAEPKSDLGNSPERRGYDALRKDLSDGERNFSRFYIRVLTRSLDATDRFLGDMGKPNRKLSKLLFNLTEPFPLWTVASFDTCLVLALVYPIATVFFFWALSGHVGPAEAALNLKSNFSPIERWLAFLAVVIQVVAMRYYVVTKSFRWALVAFIVAVGLAIMVSVAAAGAIGLAQGAYFGAEVPLFGGVLLGIAWIVTFTFATAFTLRDWPAALLASSVAIIFAATMFLNRAIPIDRSLKRVYLALLIPGTIAACFCAAYFLSKLVVWNFIGPLLLFGALLTVLNAPFDWLSVGLTRGLLRRGLEKGGWAPLLFSLVDAGLATFLIAALVPVMVVGIQLFDRIAEHGGGHAILQLKDFFDGIEADPFAAEYWWVYALLLSTMIPSLLNLWVGGFSIVRVLSGMSPHLLERLPSNHAVISYDRPWIASCLTAQVVGGWFIGLVIQALFAWGILVHLLPRVGLELLHVARQTAALDVPSLVGLR